eukprot:754418-Hanusia_phi.AAC.2
MNIRPIVQFEHFAHSYPPSWTTIVPPRPCLQDRSTHVRRCRHGRAGCAHGGAVGKQGEEKDEDSKEEEEQEDEASEEGEEEEASEKDEASEEE